MDKHTNCRSKYTVYSISNVEEEVYI